MARSTSRRRPRAHPKPPSGSAQERQRQVSGQLAGVARRSGPGAARRASGRPRPGRTQVLERPARGQGTRIRATAMLLRFVGCGLVSLVAGLAWFLTHRDQRVSPAGALFGAFLLLSGFLVGGIGWYLLDARRRMRNPERIDDEYIVFSFTVFVIVPFLVALLVLVVWLVALIVGRS